MITKQITTSKNGFLSTQVYDKEFFEKYNTDYGFTFLEVQLNARTVTLIEDAAIVCVLLMIF
jgi:D-lactate dehydrogenase